MNRELRLFPHTKPAGIAHLWSESSSGVSPLVECALLGRSPRNRGAVLLGRSPRNRGAVLLGRSPRNRPRTPKRSGRLAALVFAAREDRTT